MQVTYIPNSSAQVTQIYDMEIEEGRLDGKKVDYLQYEDQKVHIHLVHNVLSLISYYFKRTFQRSKWKDIELELVEEKRTIRVLLDIKDCKSRGKSKLFDIFKTVFNWKDIAPSKPAGPLF